MKADRANRRRLAPLLVAVGAIGVGCIWLFVSAWLESRQGQPAEHETSKSRRFASFRLKSLGKLDLLQNLELSTYDWRMQLASKSSAPLDGKLGVVYADDSTVVDLENSDTLVGESYGLFWPRYIYGRVLRELCAQGALAVAFDILMDTARFDQAALKMPDGNVIDSDQFLADQIGEATNTTVILAALDGLPPSFFFRRFTRSLGEVSSPRDVDGVARRARAFADYTMVGVDLQVYALRNGLDVDPGTNGIALAHEITFVNRKTGARQGYQINPDGTVEIERRKGLKFRYKARDQRRIWHLGIMLAAQKLNLDLENAEIQPDRIVLSGTNDVKRVIPVDRHGYFYIDWAVKARSPELPSESLQSVLKADVARQAGATNLPAPWKDRMVIIGSLATGNNMADIGATPIDEKDYLLGTHVNIANSVIADRFISRLGLGWRLALVIALGGLAAYFNTWTSTGLATVLTTAVGLVYFGIATWWFVHSRLWLPMAHPLIGGLLFTHGGMLTYRALFEEKERQRVRSVFAKVVSPDIVQELLRSERFGLAGARRQITVFFADIRGFTEMTDRHQAAAEEHVAAQGLKGPAADAYFEEQAREVLDTVNLYLATIADVIKRHQGTLDKYIGDCVMAFWGAPAENPRHAVDCVRASIDAQRAIHKLNWEREQENVRREAENKRRAESGEPRLKLLSKLALGTGVNTGTMTVGLMGSDAHILNYTVFGREVNLASRLEGVSGRSRIIIGEATFRELQRDAADLAASCIEQEPVTVKGFRHAVNVYEVPWRQEETSVTVELHKKDGPR